MSEWQLFISDIIYSLSWPAAIVICVLLLKKPFLSILSGLKTFKGLGLELSFSEKIDEIASQEKHYEPQHIALTESQQHLIKLTEVSPRAAIIEAWIDLESAAQDLLQARGITTSKKSPVSTANLLSEFFPEERWIVHNFHEMRSLRNMAAHSSDLQVTPAESYEYVKATNRLASYLRSKM